MSYLYPSPLVNKSVSCWLNSIIQSMCTSPDFCAIIKKNIKTNGMNDVYRGFYSFITKNELGYNTEECSNQILESLNKLNRDSMYSAKMIQNQQCALEFFENILEALRDPEIIQLFRCAYLRVTKCPSCLEEHKIVNAHRYVSMYKNSHIPNFHDSKKYPNTKKFVLDLIGTSEIIDCWKCPKCLVESKDVKSDYRIVLLPKIFVIQFDKLTDNSPINLEEKFSLKFRDSPELKTYKAIATINHYGTSVSGHYLANCIRRRPIDNELSWFCCNDQYIYELTEPPLSSTDIYMVFYTAI